MKIRNSISTKAQGVACQTKTYPSGCDPHSWGHGASRQVCKLLLQKLMTDLFAPVVFLNRLNHRRKTGQPVREKVVIQALDVIGRLGLGDAPPRGKARFRPAARRGDRGHPQIDPPPSNRLSGTRTAIRLGDSAAYGPCSPTAPRITLLIAEVSWFYSWMHLSNSAKPNRSKNRFCARPPAAPNRSRSTRSPKNEAPDTACRD